MNEVVKVSVSLLPVFVFLAALIVLDSYKLVKLPAILITILVGCLSAILSLFINSWLLVVTNISVQEYSKYISPIIEETLKAVYLIYLLKSRKVGFMVDASIYGFALGAGFAFVENIYYLSTLQNPNLLLWIVRGFGTAVMHGSATAIFAIVSKAWSDRRKKVDIISTLRGFVPAVFIHSVFNHFILPPLITMLGLLVALPLLVVVVFSLSEKVTRNWLGIGFDTDVQLLEMLNDGKISETRIGLYLSSLQSTYPGEVVADMVCLLRLHLELAIRAKGVLLMHKTGFKPATDPEIAAKFEELKYLEKNIGTTGKIAISPFLHTSSRDLWQLYMVGKYA